MTRSNRLAVLVGVAAICCLGNGQLEAENRQGGGGGQGRGGGNFDPAQFQQRMMERYREQLEIKGDDEWKVIEPRITKIQDAQREVRSFSGFGGFGRGGGRQRGNGDNAQGNADNQGARRGGRGGFGGEPSPEVDALQKAIEAKASAEELKTKLAKVRAARKEKEANLEKAQEELRKVLSVRQEASAVLA